MPREIKEVRKHGTRGAVRGGKSDVLAKTAAAPSVPSVNRDQFELYITPSPLAEEAVVVLGEARELAVVDRSSHGEALKVLRRAKGLQRDIAGHWKTMKQAVNKLLTHLRDLEGGEVGPAAEAIALIESKVGPYERAEEARVAAAQEAERKAAQERADAARAKELADAEAAALEAEAGSEDLSEREQQFVAIVARNLMSNIGATDAAEQVGYKDPAKRAQILLSTPKIIKALSGLRAAAAIRQQASARAQQPVIPDVVDVKPELAKVSGVSKRVTYNCESADLLTLLEAWKRGDVGSEVFLVNMPFLNSEARDLRDLFEQKYPGCTLGRRGSHAG